MTKMAGSTDPRGQSFPSIYPGTTQKLAIGASTAASSAVGASTTAVRLCSDVDCFIAIAPTPVATNTSTYLPAKIPSLFAINPGDKIAVIQSSGAGSLYITEGA